jgi:hypothetical protein
MSGYRLVFGYSSSPSYPEAVQLPRNCQSMRNTEAAGALVTAHRSRCGGWRRKSDCSVSSAAGGALL